MNQRPMCHKRCLSYYMALKQGSVISIVILHDPLALSILLHGPEARKCHQLHLPYFMPLKQGSVISVLYLR